MSLRNLILGPYRWHCLVPLRTNASSTASNSLVKKTDGIDAKKVKIDEFALKMTRLFEYHLSNPSKSQFQNIVEQFIASDKLRRGHVAFVSTALGYMEKYGVDYDLLAYNKLLDVFPRNRINNKTLLDLFWPKGYPQIYTALDLLTQMEYKAICPDEETHRLVQEVFGHRSLPVDKVVRLKVWFEFSKTLNPYSLPSSVYDNKYLLAKSAMERMCGCSTDNVITLKGDENDADDFILCAYGKEQANLMKRLSSTARLFIDGPQPVWLYRSKREYFALRVPACTYSTKPHADDAAYKLAAEDQSSEPVEDVVLSILMCDKPTQGTFDKWIEFLQEKSPNFRDCTVLMAQELQSDKGDSGMTASWATDTGSS